jgi:hypothetical protein
VATFEDLVFDHNMDGILHHGAHIHFENGYGASVIFGELISVHGQGFLELAVLKKNDKDIWELCYDTPLTDDVIPNLMPDEVTDLLGQIEAL